MATARILLLVNYRPEYQHEWGSKTYYTQLRLDPLGKEEAQELLTALLGEWHAHLQPLKQLILEKTEGNPFFMEEIVQALRRAGSVGTRCCRGDGALCPYQRTFTFPPPCRACSPLASTGSRQKRKRCCRPWR